MLADPAFRRTFLPAAKHGDEEAAIKEFTKNNKTNALKTRPKVRKSLPFRLVAAGLSLDEVGLC